MLQAVKISLRISNNAFDPEINDLIDACRADLMLSGVKQEKANSDTDPLVKRAIVTYVKAHFGWDNPDAERLATAYMNLKSHLTLAGDYT